MKTISILLLLLLFPVLVFADCQMAAKWNDEGAELMIECDGISYDNCNGQDVINEDGKVFHQIMCCNDQDKCIYLLVPTEKVGM